MSGSLIPKAMHEKNTTTNWDNHIGVFQTKSKSTVSFQLPELDHTKFVIYVMHVDDTNNYHQYDMIMVQELTQELFPYNKLSD